MNVDTCESWIPVLGDLGINQNCIICGDGTSCVSINHDAYHKLIVNSETVWNANMWCSSDDSPWCHLNALPSIS